MKPDIFFSVIIPTYNRADFIKNTIQSILQQTYQNFEIIVVDDGSTDDTKQVVTNIPDKRIQYYYKENAERGAARNFGALKAKGKYLNFFDSDDIALPYHLEEAKKVIDKNKTPEVLALRYEIVDSNLTKVITTEKYFNINKQLVKGNLLSCNPVFVRKDIFLQHQFSEKRELSASEDYLLWLQLAAQHHFYFSNKVTSYLISHDKRSVLQSNKEKLIKRKLLMLDEALNDNKISKYYHNQINYLKENTYSYISLHLAMAKHKKDSIKFLLQALQYRPSFIFTHRFLAILKKLLWR